MPLLERRKLALASRTTAEVIDDMLVLTESWAAEDGPLPTLDEIVALTEQLKEWKKLQEADMATWRLGKGVGGKSIDNMLILRESWMEEDGPIPTTDDIAAFRDQLVEWKRLKEDERAELSDDDGDEEDLYEEGSDDHQGSSEQASHEESSGDEQSSDGEDLDEDFTKIDLLASSSSDGDEQQQPLAVPETLEDNTLHRTDSGNGNQPPAEDPDSPSELNTSHSLQPDNEMDTTTTSPLLLR